MSGTYHNSLFFYGRYPKRAIGYVLNFLHTVHMCDCGPTSQFTHLLGPFLIGQAFSGSYWCQTPIKNSDCHDSVMVNIMIVSMPRSVRVYTIVKGEGVSPNAWGPNIFPFSISYISTPLASSFISFYHIFHAWSGLYFMSIRHFACQSYHISFMLHICHIIAFSCLQT